MSRVQRSETLPEAKSRRVSTPGSHHPPDMNVTALRSPLPEAGLGKEDVRALAATLGLSNWDLPASPCLASRFPYGEEITLAALRMVETGERLLRGPGFAHVWLRHHGRTARIEVAADDIQRLASEVVHRLISRELRALGYTCVTLDLDGFRSGSLNEAVGDLPDGGT